MTSPDALEVGIIIAGTIIFIAILFGPSLFSSYQNWKMNKDRDG